MLMCWPIFNKKASLRGRQQLLTIRSQLSPYSVIEHVTGQYLDLWYCNYQFCVGLPSQHILVYLYWYCIVFDCIWLYCIVLYCIWSSSGWYVKVARWWHKTNFASVKITVLSSIIPHIDLTKVQWLYRIKDSLLLGSFRALVIVTFLFKILSLCVPRYWLGDLLNS